MLLEDIINKIIHMKKILLFLFILIVNQAFSQKYKSDTVIYNQFYKSYFYDKFKEPLYITYNFNDYNNLKILTSKNDSLYIISGGIFRKKQVISNNAYISTEYYNVIQNKDNKDNNCLIFTNNQDDNTVKIKTIKNIETILNLNLPISQ